MFQILIVIIYLSFISLGLPDSLLGAAWPIMYREFGVPVSCAGIISMVIAGGTIISSLQSDRINRKIGPGRVTALSVAATALALFGFSTSHSLTALILWAIPYGLGAGGVDAALNNYVALHYSSRTMSWLHCMWGVGTSISPYIMSYALTNGQGWHMGYRYVCFLQIALTLILVLSLPLWKESVSATASSSEPALSKPLSLVEVLQIPGAKEIMTAFFCYCAVEQTALLWASSYLTLHEGLNPETAASLASLFCLGITAGRGVNGFLTMRFSDTQLIRLGQGIIALGALLILLPLGVASSMTGFILVGLGCAPVYPCIIHSTPSHFGADNSQAVIGVQMAFAYLGTLVMPTLFGVIANQISTGLLPVYLLLLLGLMIVMHERLCKIG